MNEKAPYHTPEMRSPRRGGGRGGVAKTPGPVRAAGPAAVIVAGDPLRGTSKRGFDPERSGGATPPSAAP